MTWNPEDVNETLRQETLARLRAEGKEEFLTLEEGVTVLTVDTSVAIREMNGEFGVRKIFRVTVNKKPYDLPLSPSTAKQLTKCMMNDKTNKVQIIRAGQKKQTRYSIKKA